ncbi:condensin complex subunit 2/barren [Lipomyces oligophaga]|uniref:condensin complex subunit 2/barren n=1 Tax=Lipomyces oligophaga TaxID=45792 RepID=UPI0034CDD740
MPRLSYSTIETPNASAATSRRSKKTVNLSPNKRLSSMSNSSALNDDQSEKLMRASSRRTALEEMNRSIIAAATPSRRISSDGSSADSTPRPPSLSNFEEWMKLATDNKINAANTWNFALIDYFHDMSLLKEGNGINFQKASCTLDGCVKIYTSRIDSVASETGKLLSGLSENASKQHSQQNANYDDSTVEEDTEDGGEDNTKSKSRRRVRSENTLAKDFNALQLKKLDLEFSVDPLFKKATADFDEGGTKGLLLNQLDIDSTGRVVFDTSQDAKVNVDDESVLPLDTLQFKELDLNSLRDRYFGENLENLDSRFISPSLKDFEFPADPNQVPANISFLRTFENLEEEGLEDNYMASFGDQDYNDPIQETSMDDYDTFLPKEEFGAGGDEWLANVKAGTELPDFDDEHVVMEDLMENEGAQVPGSYILQFVNREQEQKKADDDLFAYFDERIKKNWTGALHWKIQRYKSQGAKKSAQSKQTKKKEELVINFTDFDSSVSEDTLFEPASSSSTSMPKSQWMSESRNLLPDDIRFNSKILLRLFLKPKVQLRFLKPEETKAKGPKFVLQQPQSTQSRSFANSDYNNRDVPLFNTDNNGALPNYDADFFQDDGFKNQSIGADDELDDDGFVDALESLDRSAEMTPVKEEPAILESDKTIPDITQMHPGNLTTMIRREEAQEEFEFGSQLVVNNNRRFKAEYVNYARVAKKVDVKKLKENIWSKLDYEDDNKYITADSKSLSKSSGGITEHEKTFSGIVGQLESLYSNKAMSDISTSFCFICLLHLANEKGLTIENNDSFSDLSIRKDPTAIIDEY